MSPVPERQGTVGRGGQTVTPPEPATAAPPLAAEAYHGMIVTLWVRR